MQTSERSPASASPDGVRLCLSPGDQDKRQKSLDAITSPPRSDTNVPKKRDATKAKKAKEAKEAMEAAKAAVIQKKRDATKAKKAIEAAERAAAKAVLQKKRDAKKAERAAAKVVAQEKRRTAVEVEGPYGIKQNFPSITAAATALGVNKGTISSARCKTGTGHFKAGTEDYHMLFDGKKKVGLLPPDSPGSQSVGYTV